MMHTKPTAALYLTLSELPRVTSTNKSIVDYCSRDSASMPMEDINNDTKQIGYSLDCASLYSLFRKLNYASQMKRHSKSPRGRNRSSVHNLVAHAASKIRAMARRNQTQ